MVVCVLVIAWFVQIATCNPCLSPMTNNKYPAMTTSYATSMIPGEDCDFVWEIPMYNSYTYPEISRPMAITPVPIPMDLRTDGYIPEFYIPNDYYAFNGYTPRIGASQSNLNFLDHPIFPRLSDDIPIPKYQYKHFSESFNTFLDNVNKVNELNFKNSPLPLYSVENSQMCDYETSPLKKPLSPQDTYSEFPIRKPYINYNNNNCQDDGQENIRNTYDELEDNARLLQLTNISFFNSGTSTVNNGYYSEEDFQKSNMPYLNKYNPFNSNKMNQQCLLGTQMLQEKQVIKPDQDNLGRINIDINIPNSNYIEQSIPIEITITENSNDLSGGCVEEEVSSIVIDIYDCSMDQSNDCDVPQQYEERNTSMDLKKSNGNEFKVSNSKNCNNTTTTASQIKNMPSRISLREFSSYLAETILSALQSFLIEDDSIDMNDFSYNDAKPCNSNNNSLPPSEFSSLSNVGSNKLNLTAPTPINSENTVNESPSSPNLNYACVFPYQTLESSLPMNCEDEIPKESTNMNTNSNLPDNSTQASPPEYCANDKSSVNSPGKKPETSSYNTTDNQPETPSANNTNNSPESPVVNSTDYMPETPPTDSTDNIQSTPTANSTNNKPEIPAANSTDNKPETPATNSTDNKPETPAANSTDNKPTTASVNNTDINSEIPTANNTDNQPGTTLTNSTNIADNISDGCISSNIPTLSSNGTSPLGNNSITTSDSEACSCLKGQPRLSTITINIAPVQDNNQHIIVFV